MMDCPIIGITTDIKDDYCKLKRYYSYVIRKADGLPVLIPPLGNSSYYAKLIHGLIIPGGNDLNPMDYNEIILPDVIAVSRKRSEFEFELLRNTISLQKPILGICYGMQLINVFWGGTLYQDINSQIQVEIDHKKGYHTIVITENRFLKKGTFSVNSSHHQAIKKLGSRLTTCAYSTDNLIEAFYMEKYPYLLGVQWHPERMAESELSAELFMSFIKASNDSK